jgi:mannonate dehydratase
MPLYQLLGGKCRVGVPVYRHAAGATHEVVAERARQFMAEGARYIRIQVGVPGQATYGSSGATGAATNSVSRLPGHFSGDTFEPTTYRRTVPKLFKAMREALGDEVELLHDMHERLHPIDAINVCREIEQYRPFFLEDPFAPEDVGYFKTLRQLSACPIAMGELFNNPNEYVDIIKDRLIDFIRCHISQIGGISVARKLAALCEFFRVRTAWHGPGDTSPVGHAAHVHLDLATSNFGIQEAPGFNDALKEVFPGCPELKDGMLWSNEKPGLGIDINEELAAKYPIRDDPPFDLNWGRLRDRDGTIRRP